LLTTENTRLNNFDLPSFDGGVTIFPLKAGPTRLEVPTLVHEPDTAVATTEGPAPAGIDASKGGLVWLFGLGGHRKVPAFCLVPDCGRLLGVQNQSIAPTDPAP
jgi:hypothetical protein